MVYQSTSNKNTRKNNCKIIISAPGIEPKDPTYYYVLGGKWVYSIGILVGFIQSIDVYSPDVAVKRYGNKAKNGAISIICLPGVLDIPKFSEK